MREALESNRENVPFEFFNGKNFNIIFKNLINYCLEILETNCGENV